ncbi:MAG: dual specificity protein phosphatase family protein [Verrucomicrobiota bacterium]
MNEVKPITLWWVLPAVLAGMPMPFIRRDRRMDRGSGLSTYDDDLPILRLAGIRAVVSLLDNSEDDWIFDATGFAFHCVPVAEGGAPTMEQALGVVRFVNRQRAGHRPVAVHCEAGIGRTGTVLAACLISQGDGVESAIARVRSVRQSAIETPAQIEFLKQFARWPSLSGV